MKYLGNENNIVRTALLAANNVVASQVYKRVDVVPKAGRGQVSLSGSFTGDSDATFSIRIEDTSGTNRRISLPQYSGVGNSVLSGLTALDTLDPQTIRITLVDLGTETLAAGTSLFGGRLEARDTGPDGNLITLDVSQDGLVNTPSSWSLQGPLRAGQNEYVGDQWNFGAMSLLSDGTLPTDCPRIRFGNDPQVYRPYSVFRDNVTVYSFSPPPLRDVQAGTKVYTVTGSRSVTITDGTDTDTLADVETVFDLLNKIKSSSALTNFSGVSINDLRPNGQGVVDLGLYTRSYIASVVREGSSTFQNTDFAISVDSTGPTEVLSLKLVDATVHNEEWWDVKGTSDASQNLPQAKTGVLYEHGAFSFTIPPAPEPVISEDDESTITARIDPSARAPGEQYPKLCLKKPVIGSNARQKTYTFEWQTRAFECSCDPDSIEGGPVFAWLGATYASVEDTDMDAVNAAIKTRMQDLYQWRADFMAANATLAAANSSISGEGTAPGSVSTTQSVVVDFLQGSPDYTFTTGFGGTSLDPTEFVRKELVSAVLRVNRVDIGAVNAATVVMRTAITDVLDAVLAANEAGTIEAAALDEWDSAFEDLKDQFDLLGGGITVGADYWRKASTFITAEIGDLDVEVDGSTLHSVPELQSLAAKLIAAAPALLTQSFDVYLERFKSRMDNFKILAGFLPPFDSTTLTDDVWIDHGGDAWFVSLDGLLPLQPNHYYHTAKEKILPNGEKKPVPTKEWGLGVAIGCGVKVGDRLYVTVDLDGVTIPQYQQGDALFASVNRAVPLSLSGGQTGNNTQTWSVTGSEDSFPNHLLNKADVQAYNYGNEADPDYAINFLLTPGTIPNELGDSYSFSVEAGRVVWRKNAGSWSSPVNLTDTLALSDGLTANFAGGEFPSWVEDDEWVFAAYSTNGVEGIRHPDDQRLTWTTSLQLDITPVGATAIEGLSICGHSIPSNAVITLQGSSDAFATTPLSQVVPWTASNIWIEVSADYPVYRLLVDTAGSIQYLWMDEPYEAQSVDVADTGQVSKIYRFASSKLRKGQNWKVRHTYLVEESFQEVMGLLQYAVDNEGRRFAAHLNGETAPIIVDVPDQDIAVTDEHNFEPESSAHRLLSFEFDIEQV